MGHLLTVTGSDAEYIKNLILVIAQTECNAVEAVAVTTGWSGPPCNDRGYSRGARRYRLDRRGRAERRCEGCDTSCHSWRSQWRMWR